MAHKQKGSGGTKKYGRNKVKCQEYKAHHQREKNKVKRILRSNGFAAAEAYAKKYGIKVPQQVTT